MNRNAGSFSSVVCVVFGAVVALAGCSEHKRTGRLTGFAQKGPQSLVELTDREGRAWKVDTVETSNSVVTFVIDSTGRVVVTTSVFPDSNGRRRSLLFVDSSEKDDALGILDRKFLSAIANQSDAYKKWLDKHGTFSHGTTQRTESFEVGGALGTSTIHVEGTTVVGLIKDAKCHCYEMGLTCSALPSPLIACINKICDLVNCAIGIANGSGSGCTQEGSDAKETCELAAGKPQ